MIKLSIIVAVYNIEEYLPNCLDSLLVQDVDVSEYEIIVVDDGSTDSSGKISDKYAKKFSQIQVLHKENGGLSDARNKGLQIAKGEYIAFVDGDDFWQGKKVLSDIFKIIENNNHPDLLLYGFSPYYTEKDTELKEYIFDEQKITNDFIHDFKYLVNTGIYKATACDKIINRKIIENNQLLFPKGKIHEDVAWCADLIPLVKTYAIYPNSFYRYRKNREGSITHRVEEKAVTDLIDIIVEKEMLLNNIDSVKGYLSYNYMLYLWAINILDKSKKKKYFNKLLSLKYLLKEYTINRELKTKVKLLSYRILGIKIAGKLEYQIRKILKKI